MRLLKLVTIRLQFTHNGQPIGTVKYIIPTKIAVNIPPTLIKSTYLYLPGPYTKIHEGSKGVIKETEADNITATA